MSFSLEVFAPSLPEDLWASWADALATAGLVVERHSGFVPERWRGGWAPFRVLVASQGDQRYPASAVAAGFEFDVSRTEEDRAVGNAPFPIADLVAKARVVCYFSTPAGRTVADLRLQSLAAATLAALTGGAVYDPQQDAFYDGDAALTNARREIAQYEADPESSWRFDAAE